MTKVLRIVDWAAFYENNRTRELKKLDWVPIPNKMDGDGYTELLDHPHGAAHFGAWIAIVEIASRCEIRGTLTRSAKIPQEGAAKSQEGATISQLRAGTLLQPHTFASLSRISRIPSSIFEEVIPRLISLGWIEYIPQESQQDTQIPQEGAAKSQEGASSRARSARFPSLPFSSVPEGESEGKPSNAPASPNGIDGFESWFERQYARHPNKRDKIPGERIAVDHFRSGKFTLEDFERVHQAWCESEDWRWKNGAKVKQTLAMWISDEGYRYLPNGHAQTNGHDPSPYLTAAELQKREAEQDRLDQEARAARVAAKQAKRSQEPAQ